MLKRKFFRSFSFCASLHICFVRCCPQRLMIPSEILSLLFIVLLFLSMILESAWPSPKQRATKAKERFLTGYAWWILIRCRRLRETSINEKRSAVDFFYSASHFLFIFTFPRKVASFRNQEEVHWTANKTKNETRCKSFFLLFSEFFLCIVVS